MGNLGLQEWKDERGQEHSWVSCTDRGGQLSDPELLPGQAAVTQALKQLPTPAQAQGDAGQHRAFVLSQETAEGKPSRDRE